MTPATKRKKKAAGTFEQRYHAGLLSHVRNPGEETLGEAYELGRSAIAEGKSLLDLASIHHQAIQGMVHEAAAAEVRKQILSCGASFLMESLSPFEMTHRGFQDAVKSLRHLNDTLEAEIKRIAYAVHDDAGQLLVAVHLALAEFAGGLPEQKTATHARRRAAWASRKTTAPLLPRAATDDPGRSRMDFRDSLPGGRGYGAHRTTSEIRI